MRTKLVYYFAHFKIFMGTGQGWFSDFKYPVLLAIALKVYLPDANVIILGLIALAAMLGMALIGWFDLKYIKLPQTTAEISTRKFNPYFSKLEKDLNSLGTTKSNG